MRIWHLERKHCNNETNLYVPEFDRDISKIVNEVTNIPWTSKKVVS